MELYSVYSFYLFGLFLHNYLKIPPLFCVYPKPISFYCWVGFPGEAPLVAQMVKNPPANAGDMGSTPGSGRSLEEDMTTHPSILAWEILWTEEPRGLQSMGSQESQTRLRDQTKTAPCSMGCVLHNVLTCPPADGHLGSLQCLAITSKAVANVAAHCAVWTYTWFSLSKTPRSGTAGSFNFVISHQAV